MAKQYGNPNMLKSLSPKDKEFLYRNLYLIYELLDQDRDIKEAKTQLIDLIYLIRN